MWPSIFVRETEAINIRKVPLVRSPKQVIPLIFLFSTFPLQYQILSCLFDIFSHQRNLRTIWAQRQSLYHKDSNLFSSLNKVKPCLTGSTKLSPVRPPQYLGGWPNSNTPCCYNSFSLLLRTAELPSFCNYYVVSSIYQLFVLHFAMAVFMCIYWHYHVNKQRRGHVVRILLNSLDCWSFKTFNHGFNHSKIHAARLEAAFVDLVRCLVTDMTSQVPLKYSPTIELQGDI